MRAAFGIASLLVVLGIGYYIYSIQIRDVTENKQGIQQVDLVAVKGGLLSLAQAERLYLASHGNYGTLDQLRQSGNVNPFPDLSSRGYVLSADVDGTSHFLIIATPKDASRTELPTLSIDETMQIK